jgi:putative ABC transport system ATP-binding protein
MYTRPDDPLGGLKLETTDLTRVVSGKVLVDHVSIQVSSGEILAVLGTSGSGKSSLLRLLNRLDEPTGGDVLFDGRSYRMVPPRQLRRRVGMVMQTSYLFPGTVAFNVAFGPRQSGVQLTNEQIDQILERVGLPGYAERDVSGLSGGEAQRVSIARTLVNDPQILLLDEPTSALDERTERGIENLILSLNQERRMTCIIVTHNLNQAMRMAPRMVVLQSGKVVKVGPTREAQSA